MKPCIPDGNDAAKIAKSLRKRSTKTRNKLEGLLNLRFTKTLTSVNIDTIEDFPKLTLKQLKNHITFGTFKLRQCPSYVGQVIDYGKAFFIKEQLIDRYLTDSKIKDELKFSKIIAVQIPSRHKRGKKSIKKKHLANDISNPNNFTTCYKTFIQYNPVQKNKDLDTLNATLRPYHSIKSKVKIEAFVRN